MRTRRRRPAPPADANDLLAALRAGRLLPSKTIRQLAVRWSESRPDEPDDPAAGTRLRARDLADAGLLTAWQVGRLLAGEGRRLRVGPYVLTEWLGAGGMGSVYKAEHRLMKRVVALKVLGDAAAGPRSRREVEAAARLAHPHIVAAYDAFRAGNSLVLVLEYVEGIDLGRLVAQAGPLPVRLACEAARQAALALHYAHGRGLLHGDVKPSNLLLAHPPRPIWDAAALAEYADGRRPTRVKLLDLGLARRLDAPADDDLMGTPDYMAPEQGAGEPADGRGDLYALGCTLYHLLTGQPPFPGGDAAAKLLRHRLDAPPPVRALRPDAPPALAAVVERLTARDPADRHATGADAAADLELCLAPAPMVVAPPPRAARPADAGSRRRRLWPVLALPALACGVLVAGVAWRSQAGSSNAAAVKPIMSPPFVIEGRPGGFSSLAEAVAAADDGAVVTIHGRGPYPTPPLSWAGRSLTLRGEPGVRPRLEAAGPPADPWEALLTAYRDLSLENLYLRSPPGAGGASGRLVCCERAALRLTDCRLTAPGGAGIVFRNGGALTLQNCRVETGGAAVSVEVGGQDACRLRIADTLLDVCEGGGAAVAVWAPAARRRTAVSLELTGDTIRASRALALTALPAGVRLTARDNDFAYRESLLSFAGYAGGEAWKEGVTWEERGNHDQGFGARLIVDGAARPMPRLTGPRPPAAAHGSGATD